MTINGPQYSNHRIDPVGDPRDDQNEGERKRRRVQFAGRTWGEKEEKKKREFAFHAPKAKSSSSEGGIYADRVSLEKAQKLFDQLTTLEEKVAQLCFLETEALYDAELKNEIELLIQAWQIGGVLFSGGDYKREAFLIEHFQRISKTFLLFGNGFFHSLSFYYQDKEPLAFKEGFSEQRCLDMGKAIMGINRRLKVHFQFDHERESHSVPMTTDHLMAFRKGVRQSSGIVARTAPRQAAFSASSKQSSPSLPSFLAANHAAALNPSKSEAQEYIGVKSLNFLDVTNQEVSEKKLLEAFKANYDIFLCGENIRQVITTITGAVRNGKLWEKHIDRLVMKLLVLKVMFNKD
ncbi:MAG: hypothetical protein S4CHLAM45_15220 [Chlamydiales bacterium]|nr:hypothetical protein [Chlamydiales bacterium]MCH9620139.1 hypothetical protein [Chlamydiales bacterium]MCH9623609.1 hypothetical protein [Chlamydiales bacterium]